MANLLEISNLSKRYGSNLALDDISLTIEKPTAIGLVGKNGAGKTTLLSILSGALRANSGSIRILGESPESIATTGKLNILPQDATFKKGISIAKQLRLFARLQGASRQQADEEVKELLAELGDATFADKTVTSLSYGQRKRLGILQAFLGKPELVILDEPTAGLDPVIANDVRQLIRKLSGESAFIISSHNLYEIEDICSAVIILDRGRLIASKPIAELAKKENKLNLTLDRQAEANLVDRIRTLPDVITLEQDKINPEKIVIEFAEQAAEDLPLKIQQLIMEHGYDILDLSRGKALIDGMMDLVNPK